MREMFSFLVIPPLPLTVVLCPSLKHVSYDSETPLVTLHFQTRVCSSVMVSVI